MDDDVRSPIIQNILDTPPPPRLYHYTSPAGLVGIVTTRTLWATHVRFLNDASELERALDSVRSFIEGRLQEAPNRSPYSEPDLELLEAMVGRVGVGAYAVYVAALTAKDDDLSQWRAYCPAGGGYAVGIPSRRLRDMATAQGFYLAPCVYDHYLQQAIIKDLVHQYVLSYRRRNARGEDAAELRTAISEAFGWAASRYCAMLKHPAFKEEYEWRLVSLFDGPHSKICYRAGPTSVVPYLPFSFLEEPYTTFPDPPIPPDESFHVTVGPTRGDQVASNSGTQSMAWSHIGPGWCSHSMSGTPYRA